MMKAFIAAMMTMTLAVAISAQDLDWESITADEARAAIEAGADVNARDENGLSPFMWVAGGNQNPEVAAILLKAGADLNARYENGFTPLISAVASWYPKLQNPEVIMILLDAGADVNARDEDGRTMPLHG